MRGKAGKEEGEEWKDNSVVDLRYKVKRGQKKILLHQARGLC